MLLKRFRGIVWIFVLIMFLPIVWSANPLYTFNGTFFEGFESGSLVTNNWTNSGTGRNWTINSATVRSGVYSIYGEPQGGLKYLAMTISTEGYTNLSFSYYRADGGLDSGEYCGSDYWNGTAWVELDNAILGGGWTFRNYSLPISASDNQNFSVRFKVYASSTNEGCYIDDVTIKGTKKPPEASNVSFFLNDTVYPQGKPLGHGYDIYILFVARYVDNNSQPIANASCYVINDKSRDNVTLTYNSTTGNYTGLLNDYLLYGLVNFNLTCSHEGYNTSYATANASVIWYSYLADFNDSYVLGSNNKWMTKKEPEGGLAVYSKVFNATQGTNLIATFVYDGDGFNHTFLNNYNILGNHSLSVNVSVNNSICEPLLCYDIRDSSFNSLYEECGHSHSIPVNVSTVVTDYFEDNHTVIQGQYLTIEIKLNCSSSVSVDSKIYYNYSGELPSFVINNAKLLKIDSYLYGNGQFQSNYTIGPNQMVYMDAFIYSFFNNTDSVPLYTEYWVLVPVLSQYSDSIVPGSIRIYNSTGQLWASDNVSLGAPRNATLYSNNIVRYITETIPALSSVTEYVTAIVRNAIRDQENLVYSTVNHKVWEILVSDIYVPEVEVYNVTVYTNYSLYGVKDDWTIRVYKTKDGVTEEITSQVTKNISSKLLVMPVTNLSDVNYTIDAFMSALPNMTPVIFIGGVVDFVNDTYPANFTFSFPDYPYVKTNSTNKFDFYYTYNGTAITDGNVTFNIMNISQPLIYSIVNNAYSVWLHFNESEEGDYDWNATASRLGFSNDNLSGTLIVRDYVKVKVKLWKDCSWYQFWCGWFNPDNQENYKNRFGYIVATPIPDIMVDRLAHSNYFWNRQLQPLADFAVWGNRKFMDNVTGLYKLPNKAFSAPYINGQAVLFLPANETYALEFVAGKFAWDNPTGYGAGYYSKKYTEMVLLDGIKPVSGLDYTLEYKVTDYELHKSQVWLFWIIFGTFIFLLLIFAGFVIAFDPAKGLIMLMVILLLSPIIWLVLKLIFWVIYM